MTPGERTIGRCQACPASFDEDLFERLKEWRMTHSRARNVPAYVVFTDATLTAIAEQLPPDEHALSSIPGVGPMKLETYGEEILRMVRERG